MERWGTDALEGGVCSGLRVPLSAPSLCGRPDALVSSSDVVLLGSGTSGKHMLRLMGAVLLRSLGWHAASMRRVEDNDCLGFKVSKVGGDVE